MSVVSVKYGVDRSGSTELQTNELFTEVQARRYRVNFIVYTDDHITGQAEILKSDLLPKQGETYKILDDADEKARCVRVEVSATRNRKIWHGIAEWDTQHDMAIFLADPLNQPPEIQRSSIEYQEPAYRDIFGVPYVSSSLNPFDPPPMEDKKRRVFTIIRNEIDYDDEDVRKFRYTLNEKKFYKFPPLSCRMNSISSTSGFILGVPFQRVTYIIEYRDVALYDTWFREILDKDVMNYKGQLFRDSRDMVTTLAKPQLLNGRGEKISVAKTKLTASVSVSDSYIKINNADENKFPPKPVYLDEDNNIYRSPHMGFEININGEIMIVYKISDTKRWYVVRGARDTEIKSHPVDSDVILEPYFLRFHRFKWKDWYSLDLPDPDVTPPNPFQNEGKD